MKKIAICSLLVTAFVGTASASIIKDADCKTEFRPENNNWMARSNEYLFPTEKDYLNVVNRGKVYECDNEYCGHNTYVSLPAGHFFNGNYKSQPATYKCVLGKTLGVEWIGDDKWENVDSTSGLTKCTKTHDKWGKTGSDSDEYLYPTKSDYDAVNKDNYGLVFECDSNSKYCHEGTTVTLGGTHYHGKTKVTGTKTYACVTRGGGDFWMEITGNGGNDTVCKNVGDVIGGEVNCSLGYGSPDTKTGDKCVQVCIKNRESGALFPNYFIKTCPASRPRGVVNKNLERDYIIPKPFNYYSKCEEGGVIDGCAQYSSQPEAYACCKYKYADWKGGTCVCQDKKAKWHWNAKTKNGFCKVPGDDNGGDEQEDDTTPDTTQQCWYQFSADLRCANGAYISQSTGYTLEVKGETCESFKSKFGDDKAFMLAMLNKFCSQQGSTPIVPDDKAFNAAKDSLNAFFNSAKSSASVWKNSEGKFNTARLASDLTAGVVLGTVGGVVSGVVIKKKQVEKGFDALHCTVGGQKVADWGDEFNIGLRR